MQGQLPTEPKDTFGPLKLVVQEAERHLTWHWEVRPSERTASVLKWWAKFPALHNVGYLFPCYWGGIILRRQWISWHILADTLQVCPTHALRVGSNTNVNWLKHDNIFLWLHSSSVEINAFAMSKAGYLYNLYLDQVIGSGLGMS